MTSNSIFTFKSIERQYQKAIDVGYEVIRCEDYYFRKNDLPEKTLVNRVDIDCSLRNTERLVDIFNRLEIKASFFLRLHAPNYNPFSFENYRIIKKIIDSGHELGYHSEVIDQSAIWGEDAESCLLRDIEVINKMFNIKIKGVASHGKGTDDADEIYWLYFFGQAVSE